MPLSNLPTFLTPLILVCFICLCPPLLLHFIDSFISSYLLIHKLSSHCSGDFTVIYVYFGLMRIQGWLWDCRVCLSVFVFIQNPDFISML